MFLVKNMYGGDPWIPCASPGAPCAFWVWVKSGRRGGSTDFFELVKPNPKTCPGHPLCHIKLKKIRRSDWCLDEHFGHITSGQAVITSSGIQNWG